MFSSIVSHWIRVCGRGRCRRFKVGILSHLLFTCQSQENEMFSYALANSAPIFRRLVLQAWALGLIQLNMGHCINTWWCHLRRTTMSLFCVDTAWATGATGEPLLVFERADNASTPQAMRSTHSQLECSSRLGSHGPWPPSQLRQGQTGQQGKTHRVHWVRLSAMGRAPHSQRVRTSYH